MKWIAARAVVLAPVVVAMALAGCEAEKSSNPLSPTVAGPIPGVNIGLPHLVQPAQGFKFRDSEQPIKLIVQNATTNGVRPLYYTFEVARDSKFASKVFSRSKVAPGANGRTSVQIDRLELGRSYYWRVRAQDGANTGTFATAGFEVYPKPDLHPPAAVAPVNNQLTSNTSPGLTVRASSRVGPIGKVRYLFQIASNQGFTAIVASATVSESGGQTTYHPGALPGNATLYWRARATDGQTTSGFSATQAFRTPSAAGPSPAPPPKNNGPCNSSDPKQIVSCERAKFGHMSEGQIVNFLISTAKSLNRNGIGGGPFGILEKGGGNNCNGYSCDIICSGQGGSQKQWDVLRDAEGAQAAAWNGPETVPHIRIDVCAIR